jgi:hypothetical protein
MSLVVALVVLRQSDSARVTDATADLERGNDMVDTWRASRDAHPRTQ